MGLLRFFQSGNKNKQTEEPEKVSTVTTITGTKGQYEGSIIEFEGSVVIGRDPSVAELIIDDNNVSRIHCTITYEPNDGTYIVTDHSTNGTFISGQKIGKGKSRVVPKGTFVVVGQNGNNFRLD